MNAKPPSSVRSWRDTSRPRCRSAARRWPRQRHQRVVGDHPQRDGRPRAGRLPRAAAHQRRAHPHRQGLPPVRRLVRPGARSARRAESPAGQLVLRQGARRARGHAAEHQPAAVEPHRLRRRRRRPVARGGDDPLRAGGEPRPAHRARRRRARERRRREGDDRSRRRHRRRAHVGGDRPPHALPHRLDVAHRRAGAVGRSAARRPLQGRRQRAAGRALRGAVARLRRRRVADGGRLRRGRDRAARAHHARAAVRRRRPAARRPRPRTGVDRRRARRRHRSPSARSSSTPTRSMATRRAPSACSAPPACTIRKRSPPSPS